MTNQTKNSMLLMLCALIWGTAFVAQSAGSGMGAFSSGGAQLDGGAGAAAHGQGV